MADTTLDAVRNALRAVKHPDTGADIVAAGLVRGLVVRDGKAAFVIEAPRENPSAYQAVRDAAEAAARSVPGVDSVTAVLTAEAAPGAAPRAAAPPGVTRVRHGAPAAAPPPQRQGAAPGSAKLALDGVRHVVAVASGKGGVGKSTVAVNLACALARQGLKTGLLDADVYGPSVPTMTGLEGAKPQAREDGKLEPLEAYGLKLMSMGFVVDADTAMIWRGPMVMSALTQMLGDVAWAPLDVLVLDLPPGTGDAQLTLAQRAPISGAVIVSTPQKVALADVRRGVEMFRRTHIPILGVVENMSAMRDPATGATFAPFGAGGARAAAAEMGADFLAAIPIDPRLAELSDAGRPPAATEPDSTLGAAFADLARGVMAALDADPRKPAPKIEIV